MYVPSGGTRATQTEFESGRRTVPMREHYICGSVALFVTSVLTLVTYSVLVNISMGFGLLATTMLVFAVAIFWFLLWELFVVAWEWRAGRLSFPTLR